MIIDTNIVTHTLSVNGEEIDKAESGYHLESIADKLDELIEKHLDKCKPQYEKYFGDDAEYSKARNKIMEISEKPVDKQTDEDREEISKFLKLQSETFSNYVNDPECVHVKSEMTRPNGEKIELFESGIVALAIEIRSRLIRRSGENGIGKLFSNFLFDVFRKSNLKAVAIALKFEDDPTGAEKSSALMALASPFRDITDRDVNVLDGTLMQLHDRTIPEMRKTFGIKEEPEIIV